MPKSLVESAEGSVEVNAWEPAGTRLGVVRGITYGLFASPDPFIEQTRALGAGIVRTYLYWSQIEPNPGKYKWGVVDNLLEECDGDEELWITVCSSSPWATKQPTDFLPPSPAHDVEDYRRFVEQLVRRCAGRVQYWQCDNEPSNVGLLWAGSAAEYVAQLRIMYQAVKAADPTAAVVLGGCGYDVLSSKQGSEPRQFFDDLVARGRDFFDLFDIHLYGDTAKLSGYIDQVRAMMRAHGYEKPMVVGEYNGPSIFEFPEAEAILQQAMMQAFSEGPGVQSTSELTDQANRETPERRAMRALYDRAPELPPQLRMFMADCPTELDEKRYRISCRGLVMRNMLALAAGIRRTAYWNLAPEIPGYEDPFQMMDLMFRTYALMGYYGTKLTQRHPTADAFAHMVEQLGQVEQVQLLATNAFPTLRAFEVRRVEDAPLLVLWDERDAFDGENQPPMPIRLPWTSADARATDAFGNSHQVEVAQGELRTELSVTPIFVAGAQ